MQMVGLYASKAIITGGRGGFERRKKFPSPNKEIGNPCLFISWNIGKRGRILVRLVASLFTVRLEVPKSFIYVPRTKLGASSYRALLKYGWNYDKLATSETKWIKSLAPQLFANLIYLDYNLLLQPCKFLRLPNLVQK